MKPRNRNPSDQDDIKKFKKSVNTAGRKDYHFMMNKELHKKLRNVATDREITVSSLFEEIAYLYLTERGISVKLK